MTYVYVLMEVSDRTYDEVAAKLRAADYGHALMENGALNMHEIALVREVVRPVESEAYDAHCDHIEQSDDCVRRLGYDPRQLQLRWRTDPPELPADPPSLIFGGGEQTETRCSRKAMEAWQSECLAAVVDALVHEGVDAWPGDATSCVAQIIEAFARLARDRQQNQKE